jgi:hypothetical protein
MSFKEYAYDPLPTPTSIRLLEMIGIPPSDLPLCRELECNFPNGYPTIICSLKTVDLQDEPNFDALSYTWGNPLTVYYSKDTMLQADIYSKQRFQIICDGRSLVVGHNLFIALLYLLQMDLDQRDETKQYRQTLRNLAGLEKSRFIWIDAICIDQTNLAERSAQVIIMDKIYRQAAIVLVWLGKEDASTKDALDAIQTINEMYKKLREAHMGPEALIQERINGGIYRRLGVPALSERQWLALYVFLQRAWFHRAWTVQELALSKHQLLLCGILHITWPGLCLIVMFLQLSGWSGQVNYLAEKALGENNAHPATMLDHLIPKEALARRAPLVLYKSSSGFRLPYRGNVALAQTLRAELDLQATAEQRGTPERLTLSDLLHQARITEASDPRDKVYAFIGVSTSLRLIFYDDPTVDLTPDYQKSVSEVYTNTARFALQATGNLEILSYVQDRSIIETPDLPSWVPDYAAKPEWEVLDKLTRWSTSGDKSTRTWSASGDLAWRPSTGIESCLLHVQGSLVDRIARVQSESRDPLLGAVEFAGGLPLRGEREHAQGESQFLRPMAMVLKQGEAKELVRSSHPSLVEVLWRTLIADHLRDQHPAPLDCGFAFGDMVCVQMAQLRLESAYEQVIGTAVTPVASADAEALRSSLMDTWRDLPPDHDYGWHLVEGRQDGNANRLLKQVHHLYSHPVGLKEFEAVRVAWDQLAATEPASYFDLPDLVNIKGILDAALAPQRLEVSFLSSSIRFLYDLPRLYQSMDLTSNFINERASSRRCQEFKEALGFGMVLKRLFQMESHLLGRGPKSVDVGDQIWILAGANVPFVLRPMANGRFQVIGEAYVHGIMHGEVLNRGNVEFQDIILE